VDASNTNEKPPWRKTVPSAYRPGPAFCPKCGNGTLDIIQPPPLKQPFSVECDCGWKQALTLCEKCERGTGLTLLPGDPPPGYLCGYCSHKQLFQAPTSHREIEVIPSRQMESGGRQQSTSTDLVVNVIPPTRTAFTALSDDYRHVLVNGKEYTLPPNAAKAVKYLYDKSLIDDQRWHTEKQVRFEMSLPRNTTKLPQWFRRAGGPAIFDLLIERKNGMYRFKMPKMRGPRIKQ
jgi:hypothetical protein